MKSYGRLLKHWVLMTSIFFRIVTICRSEFKRNYKQKRKTSCELFVPFLEFTSSFKHFEKKMLVMTNVFPKLKTVKDVVRHMSKKPCFRTRFGIQHVKESNKRLVKCAWEHFYHIFSSFSDCEGNRYLRKFFSVLYSICWIYIKF